MDQRQNTYMVYIYIIEYSFRMFSMHINRFFFQLDAFKFINL